MSIQYFNGLEDLKININQHLLVDGEQRSADDSMHKLNCALHANWLQILSKDVDLSQDEFELRLFDEKSITDSLNDLLVAKVTNHSDSDQYFFKIDHLYGLPKEISELSDSSNEFLLGQCLSDEIASTDFSQEFSPINKPLTSRDVVPVIYLPDSLENHCLPEEEHARALQKKKPKSTTVLKLMNMARSSDHLPILYGSHEEILYTWIQKDGRLIGDEGDLNATPWCRKYTRRKSKDGIKPMFVYIQTNGLMRKESILDLYDKGFVLPNDCKIGKSMLEKAENASHNYCNFQLNYLLN